MTQMKGKLAAIFKDLESRPDVTEALTKHLLGGTPADKLARDLTESGWPIGATAIKDYRRMARENGDMSE